MLTEFACFSRKLLCVGNLPDPRHSTERVKMLMRISPPTQSAQRLNKVFISCRSKFNNLFTWRVSTLPATPPQFLSLSGDRACLVVFCFILFVRRQLCRQPLSACEIAALAQWPPLINHPVRLFIMWQPSRHLSCHWLLSPWHSV